MRPTLPYSFIQLAVRGFYSYSYYLEAGGIIIFQYTFVKVDFFGHKMKFSKIATIIIRDMLQSTNQK